MTDKPYRFDTPTRTAQEKSFLERLEIAAKNSQTSYVEKFSAFPVWAPRQEVARFLAQWELFKLVQDIHGSIVECGVAFGGGVMAWAHFLSIAESVAHTRRVIGFDTFAGFPGMDQRDSGAKSGLAYAGGMSIPLDDEIAHLAALHDTNRAVGHVPRVELVKGDACETIPRYVSEHQELTVSLLVMDFDVYAPTIVGLTHFLPRMPRGAIVCLDEMNCTDWPGESVAVRESGLLERGRLVRCQYTSTMSYVVLD